MELKRGYQNTEIGIIPNEWEVTDIASTCKLINGRGFKPFEWKKEGLPIIRIQNLNGSNEFNYYDGAYDKKIEVEKDQLLFAWSGSRGTSFGPHIWKGVKGVLNYHTWKVNVYEDRIDRRYFLHTLKELTKKIEDSAHGASALVHVQKWEIEKVKFAIPKSKIEQTAIATALSDADALIASLEKIIAKKRLIKQGVMQKLLEPKAGWEVKRLSDVLKVKHGKSQHEVVTSNGKYPILATSGVVGYSNRYLYSKPSVLIGRKGTIDVPQFMETPFWSIDTLFYTEIHEQHYPMFVFYLFTTIDWYAYNEASGVPSLNAKTIENIERSFPKSKKEEIEISNTIKDFDRDILQLEQKLSKAKTLKQGMMQTLLTGKIRLV